MSNSLKAHLDIGGERLVAFEADEISVFARTELNRDPRRKLPCDIHKDVAMKHSNGG